VTTFLYSKQIIHMTGLLAIPFGAFAGAGIALWGWMTVRITRKFRRQLPREVLTWIVRAMGVVLIGVAAWSVIQLTQYIRDPKARPASVAARDH
jgi:hypothetical protein